MYKIIGSFLLFALFISASAFTTAVPAASASSQKVDGTMGIKALTSLTASQTASKVITGTWTVVPPTGSYVVRLMDSSNAILQTVVTNNLTYSFKGLTIGETYRVSVWDMQGTALISNEVLITF